MTNDFKNIIPLSIKMSVSPYRIQCNSIAEQPPSNHSWGATPTTCAATWDRTTRDSSDASEDVQVQLMIDDELPSEKDTI